MKRQKFIQRIIFLSKVAGCAFVVSLFLFCLGVSSVKADSPYLTDHGEIFTGTLGTSDYARVIKVGSTYHMWYEDTAAGTLYHTTSSDGENWNVEVLCDITDIHEPSVIWDSSASKFKIWYESLEAGHDGEIWYAQSSNGVNWDGGSIQEVTFSEAGNLWEDNGRYMPFVIKEGTRYKMWYQSFSVADPGDKRLNYATSDDGTFWDNTQHLGRIDFGGSTDNNIVFGIEDPGNWDSNSFYSQSILDVTEAVQVEGGGIIDQFYLMLYGGHDGDGEFKLGVSGSGDGVEWYRSEPDEYVISEPGASIYFPSMVLSMNGDDLENAYLQIWYMKGTDVYYATLGEILEGVVNDDDENGDKAHVDSWEAYRYEDPDSKLCTDKLKITIKGKHFDKDAEVKIGNHKAFSVDKKSSHKIVAKFCYNKLVRGKVSHKKTIRVINPDADTEKADKKINLDSIGHSSSEEDFNPQTVEGTMAIQRTLVTRGLLDGQYITGFYGPITTEAVKKFQEQNGIPNTGYVGPLTKAKLAD